MSKIWICALAIGASIALAAPASAAPKGGFTGNGYHYGYSGKKAVKVMPPRSNKYGYRRGHARADYVHSLNRARR